MTDAYQDDTEDPWQHQLRQRERLSLPFDYIVCGSGSSGCVAAARLAEDPTSRVLLIEAGGRGDGEIISNPNRWPQTLATEFDWAFKTSANVNLNGRSIPCNMGKVLGGGSSINVSTWSRGHKADWDFFAAASGEDAWSYDRVSDLYRENIEAWAGAPDQEFRGSRGMVHVQPAANPHSFAFAVLDAAESVGFARYPNSNGLMMEAEDGCSLIDETVYEGRRRSVFQSYVHPVLMQNNLTVLTGATVLRVLFDRNRAIGVECDLNGQIMHLRAIGEIVLSLGAVNTPKVLMLSGIGNGDDLLAHGIQVKQELPGVGRELHDHVAFGCIWQTEDETLPPIPRSQTSIFWKTDATLDAPNFYTYARRGPALSPENAMHYSVPQNTWSFMVGMRPRSRGSVRLAGADASSPPQIDTGYLSCPEDLDDLGAGATVVREIGNSPALSHFATREVTPGSIGPAAKQEFLRNGLTTFWHQSGTARMGRDSTAVVDGQLRVYGIDSLRVADSSIMPRVTTGNTMAPCVVIGEQVARFIKSQCKS